VGGEEYLLTGGGRVVGVVELSRKGVGRIVRGQGVGGRGRLSPIDMWVRGNVGNSGRVGRVAGGGRGAAEDVGRGVVWPRDVGGQHRDVGGGGGVGDEGGGDRVVAALAHEPDFIIVVDCAAALAPPPLLHLPAVLGQFLLRGRVGVEDWSVVYGPAPWVL